MVLVASLREEVKSEDKLCKESKASSVNGKTVLSVFNEEVLAQLVRAKKQAIVPLSVQHRAWYPIGTS